MTDDFYFPGETWETISALDAGFDSDAIEDTAGYLKEVHSSAFLLVKSGRIMAEFDWDPGADRDVSPGYRGLSFGHTADDRVIEDVASAQKSVVAALTGIAIGKGLLDLDDTVGDHLGTSWSKATLRQEAKITIRHLMSLTSGLTEALEYEAPPGERWFYNTPAYALVIEILAAASGLDRDGYTKEWLLDPIGMHETRWVPRKQIGDRPLVNKQGLATTARDLARFGLMILCDGQWNGRDIIGSPGWLESCFQSSNEINPAYGLLWWLNGKPGVSPGMGAEQKIRKSLFPDAPDDLVAGLGALNRMLHIVPSLDLVLVRLGDFAGPGINAGLWSRLSKAIPSKA